MGTIKKTSSLFIVMLLCIQAHAQRCGAHIIKGDHDISYEGTADKRYEMNSVMKFPQAIYVAHYLDSCGISLDQRVTVKKHDLDQNTWSPMLKCETGNNRIKAVLPPGAQLAHKTGTGFSNGKTLRGINDVGIVVMPNGDFYPIAIFIKHTKREEEVAEIASLLLSP